jgi:hypothetical protein
MHYLSRQQFSALAFSLLLVPSISFATSPGLMPVSTQAVLTEGYSSSLGASREPLTPVAPCHNPTTVMDNGDPGHRLVGQWDNTPAPTGAYNGDQLQKVGYAWNRQTVLTQVRSLWKFDCLAAGQYEVFVTWSLDAIDPRTVSTNAPFTIFRDGRRVRTVRVNQRRWPISLQHLGRSWAKIGHVQLSKQGSLQVNLANNTVTGMVLADAVYIRPIPSR